ncbi:helix-turn-helix domain-containing protein [Anaerotignum sp.]|uniref:helix-turn-helix domain-containing protein n=1 Tax=Anaerotignum sp. TaxID=2039241 RepID=UPI00332C84D0
MKEIKTQQENSNSRFVTAEEVAEIWGISLSTAYRMIRSLNKELEAKGFLTIAGKVSRRYFEEKVCL